MEEPQDAKLQPLMGNFRQPGTVVWIGLRPQREAPLQVVEEAEVITGKGLAGDRVTQLQQSKRHVTLIMSEHLAATANILGLDTVDPGLTRRNIVTKGINLMALKNKRFKLGTAVLELTAPCHPCTRMETNLGEGGFNAMRGHGGWCAIVHEGGFVKMGDQIQAID